MKAILIIFCLAYSSVFGQSHEKVHLWKGNVPNETKPKANAVISNNTSGNVIRYSEVTDPAITIYLVNGDIESRPGILIIPGGGYHHLAMDKEGFEVAEWLNTQGFNAYVLEYRVPNNEAGALMDAQRAMRLIRLNSKKWNQDIALLGVLGFSAGGSLAANLSTRNEQSLYVKETIIDDFSAKPDFSALIYGAGLADGPNGSLTPALSLNESTPSMFLFATADDKYSNHSLTMTAALRKNNTPVELHLIQNGGHGYGLRKGNEAAEFWPSLFVRWFNTFRNSRPKSAE